MNRRPRKPRIRAAPDPARYRPCARCGDCYPPYGRWPEGTVCEYCARKAMRTVGSCAGCGHEGGLPGLDAAGEPICRGCSGIDVPIDCLRCGSEGDLYGGGICLRCCLQDKVTGLLTGAEGRIPPPLESLADVLKTMPSPRSGITWLRSPGVQALLRDLASGAIALDHRALDALPASRTVEYIRGLLVESGALPPRDRYLAGYERWLDAKLAVIPDLEQRRLIEGFGRWHQLRYFRGEAAKGPVGRTSFLRAKQSTTLGLDFLVWLQGRGRRLDACTQHDIDAYFGAGPTTRLHARSFLYWAMNSRHVRRLTIPAAGSRSHCTLGDTERLEALRALLLNDTLELPWRIAAGLLLLFGQKAERITGLTVADVRLVRDGSVWFKPASDWLAVPEPFAALVSAYVPRRRNMATAANVDST